ncbi:MAG: DUF302 domain-containing protein [Burkholderiales bacterium]
MMIFVGFISGVVLTLIAVVYLFRHYMMVAKEVPYEFHASIAKLENSIKNAGWGIPGQIDVNQMTAKKGVNLALKVHIIELCKPQYAKGVLENSPVFSSMMPCRIGIFERDGKTFVAKMNTGLMSMFFGGVAGKMMKQVAAEEDVILKSL